MADESPNVESLLVGDGGTRRGDRITELWAWTVIDPNDDCEGVISVPAPWGGQMPAFGADRRRIEQYRDIAQLIATEIGRPVSLRRFSTAETIEEATP